MSGAEFVAGGIWGCLAGWLLTGNWSRLRSRLAGQKANAVEAPPQLPPTLAIRLHKLDESYGAFAQAAAHTNELAENADFKAAIDLLANADVPIATVLDYAFGVNWRLSCAAFSALKVRADGPLAAQQVAERCAQFSLWQLTFALQFLGAAKSHILASAPLAGFQDWWASDMRVPPVFAEYLSTFGDSASPELTSTVRALPDAARSGIKTLLARVRVPLADALRAQFGGSAESQEDSKFLRNLGRFWGEGEADRIVLEPEDWTEALAVAERELTRSPVRSLLVSGEMQVGKTSFLRLLADRFKSRGWRVFEASGADLQAGQIYIGELEGRLRKAVEELAVGRKIIWYVPDLLQLAQSGTHSGQSATMLDQLLPAIAGGQVLIWSEASPKTVTRLLQLRPALRRCLEVIRLEPMDETETADLAEKLGARLAAGCGLGIDPGATRTAVDAARHYLGAISLPGSALAILRLTVQRTEKPKGSRISGRDVLETLSQLTGLPLAILDSSETLDLAGIRSFFAGRVIGQPEAVNSVVERIAMLKSGLNEPGRPIGVLLFAGPTGTGKTELAKAVADYLFGSVERMVRLDMSEFQGGDAVAKILGGGGLARDADTLVTRIRKQPFSVVLLDEFEKAGSHVWDLFLQVFDDGRLTDVNGDTVDFRHCLIILTTNLGATAHRDSGLGFAPVRSPFSREQIEKAMSQTFRPEFQNRLDKVIVFQPLTRELMRGILKKELDRIFERRGLKERAWAVEWESSALEFLLEKGFSPEMGARPLKRAIDQYVIAPMAETIVEKRFPEGEQFVFVRRSGDALSADFVDPDGPGDDFQNPPEGSENTVGTPSLAGMIRVPDGSVAELQALAAVGRTVAERLDSPDWSELKRRLGNDMNVSEFWSRPDRFATLSRLELMDRLEVAGETARSMQGRLARAGGTTHRGLRELVSRLALQLHLLRAGLRDLDESSPDDAALLVEPVFEAATDDRPQVEQWRDDLATMYLGWAKRRNMKFEQTHSLPGLRGPVLIVSGFGAHRTLEHEVGLHVLERGEAAGGPSRLAVRAVVAELPQASLSKSEQTQALAAALARASRGSDIVRRYRRFPSPLVRNADGSWRSGKLDEVLAGDFDLLAYGDR